VVLRKFHKIHKLKFRNNLPKPLARKAYLFSGVKLLIVMVFLLGMSKLIDSVTPSAAQGSRSSSAHAHSECHTVGWKAYG